MGNYLSSNFIKSYQSTDLFLTILDKFNNKKFILSVCKYERVFNKGSKLYVSQEDRDLIVLDFNSSNDCLAGMQALQTAIEDLEGNCSITPSPGSLPVINSITYAQYKALQASNSLVALQWYDVADLTSIFSVGPVLRLQAKTTDDFEPKGVIPSSNISIKINCLDDTIQYYEDSDKKILGTNNSIIVDFDGNSEKITADNNSNVVSTNSSKILSYSSILELDSCENIVAFNSNLELKFCDNCNFYNILHTGGLSNYSDISVNTTSTIGKKGSQDHDFLSLSQTLYSYKDNTHIIVNNDLLTLDQTLILDNEIIEANGEFYFEVISNGSPTSYEIEIKDISNNTLFTITSNQIGFSIYLRFNKVSGLFEFISQSVIDLSGLATITNLNNLYDQINSEKVIDVTYAQLNNLISLQETIDGQYYRITDYQTNYTQPESGDSLSGSVEPIIVKAIIEKVNPLLPATWIHKIGNEAFSEEYPEDIIQYDFTVGSKGKIVYRKDTNKNLSAWYDFRGIQFRRWQVGLEASGSYSSVIDNLGLYEDYDTFDSACQNIELGRTISQDYPNIVFRGTCENIFLKDRDVDANYTNQTNIGWKEIIELDNSVFNYATWAADTNNGATRSAIASLYNSIISADKYVEVRFSELYERKINSEISKGTIYKIIDYIDQPSSVPSYIELPSSTDQEVLLVLGINENEFSNKFLSLDFKNDDITVDLPTGSNSNIPNTQTQRSGLEGASTVKNGIIPAGNFTCYLNLINWSPEVWESYRTGVMTEFGVIKDPGGVSEVITTIDFKNEVNDGSFTFQLGETYTFYFVLSGVTRYSTTSLNTGNINPFTDYFIELNPEIVYRKDTNKNLTTWYDFRHIKFRRWEDSLGSNNFIELTDPGNGESFSYLLTFDNNINPSNCQNIELGRTISQDYPNIIFQGTNFDIFLKDRDVDVTYVTASQIGWKEKPYATTTEPGIIEIATGAEVITGTDSTRAVTPATLVSSGYRMVKTFIITGNNSTTDFLITHNNNSKSVVIQIFDNASPFNEVLVLTKRTSLNSATISFEEPPTNLETFTVIVF